MSIFTYLKSHAVLAGTLVSVAVVVAIVGGRAASKSGATEAQNSNDKRIALVDVASFRNGTSTVLADGVVEAQSQADLKSQIGAPIAIISVSLGQYVAAGQTILELENADIRAQLSQVQGQYGSTRESTSDKISDAYIAADNAVHADIDQFILNNVDPKPKFYTYVTDPQLAAKVRDERADLNTAFTSWKKMVDALSSSSSDAQIQTALTVSQTNLDKVTTLLNDMSRALSDTANVAASSQLPAINAMQTVVTGARSAVSGAKQGLTSSAVSSAQASVQNLEAQLAKTIIRSPIAGRIAALPLRVGEFAGPGTLLATVVGGNGLLVKAYVSGDDLSRIHVGATALIQGTSPGIVTSVAPSVSTVNRKAELSVRVTDSYSSSLVVGQNVQVSIQAERLTTSAGGPLVYTLPIQDVKILPSSASVFTVDENDKIVRHEVKLGAVRGDFVEVTAGLTDGMKIVSPVYELEEGQTVRVQ